MSLICNSWIFNSWSVGKRFIDKLRCKYFSKSSWKSRIRSHSMSADNSDPTDNVVCITKEVKTPNGETKLELLMDVLMEVLLSAEIAHLPIAILTVAGHFRAGKSFLSNLFVRHIIQSRIPDSDRPQSVEEQLENWFSWRGGSLSDTEGLHILKKPFILDLDRSHQKVALFLMDAQGNLDLHSSSESSKSVGTIAFLMSSRVLYNIKDGISGDHLGQIYEYTKLTSEIVENVAKDVTNQIICPQVKHASLMFLIRDWLRTEDHSCGFTGGKNYLKSILEEEEGSKKKAEEHVLMSNFLRSFFGEPPCFLMPTPGPRIASLGKTSQTCFIREISDDFQSKCDELAKSLFSGEHLLLKTNKDGGQLTCSDLYKALKTYSVEINEGLQGNIASFIKSDFDAQLNKHKEECINFFMNKVTERISEIRGLATQDDFDQAEVFATIFDEAMEKFDGMSERIDEQYATKWRQFVSGLIERAVTGIKICFKAERKFETHMKDFQAHVISRQPRIMFMSDNLMEELRQELASRTSTMKSEIHQSISEECGSCFFSKGKKFITDTDKSYRNNVKCFLSVGRTALKLGVALSYVFMRSNPDSTRAIFVLHASENATEEYTLIKNWVSKGSESMAQDHEHVLFQNFKLKVKLSFGEVTYTLC